MNLSICLPLSFDLFFNAEKTFLSGSGVLVLLMLVFA